MPLYDVRCLNDHVTTVYYARACDKGSRTHVCPTCGHSQSFVYSVGTGLTYFSEKRAQVIYNMGHDPVIITSPKQHREEMRQRGLALAAPRYGERGAW